MGTRETEREGFEPSVPLPVQLLSREPDSTALAPLQIITYKNTVTKTEKKGFALRLQTSCLKSPGPGVFAGAQHRAVLPVLPNRASYPFESRNVSYGEGGIRTHGTLRFNSFQDYLLRPLGHLSLYSFTEPKIYK